jgi:hypothetical protein
MYLLDIAAFCTRAPCAVVQWGAIEVDDITLSATLVDRPNDSRPPVYRNSARRPSQFPTSSTALIVIGGQVTGCCGGGAG